MKDELTYLESWLDSAIELAKTIRKQANGENSLAIFTISTTVKVPDRKRPYITPLRRITHGFIGGSVVFSQTQAILLCKYVDGLVDEILVDAEKKLGITYGDDGDIIRHFGLPIVESENTLTQIELGNLSAACYPHIRQSYFQEFKPNDLTVEAVWYLVSNRYPVLSGKKIAIIGSGNIGFKLSLKFVECGCHVELVRRDIGRGMLMANVINVSKPQSTLAKAYYNSSPEQAALFTDAIIGCTDGVPAITWKMIQSMKPDGIVIDVGKGCVHQDAIKKSAQENIPIVRCDVSSAIDGAITTIQRNREVMKNGMGRNEIFQGIYLVSGGFMGRDGDIVVDSYLSPQRIVGVANGKGDLKSCLSYVDKQNILKLNEICARNST